MGLALSTSWNAFRHSDGEGLLSEIISLGFKEIELSFDLTLNQVEGIARAVKDNRIKVTALHNFCPIPDNIVREAALPDYYSMASLDESQRKIAIKYTKRTIDTAICLGANAVVLHCGRVEIPNRTKKLIGLFEKRQSNSEEFRSLREDIIKERADNYKPFFEKTLKSLGELNSYAENKDISLGVETRFYYHEIPSKDEVGLILQKFKGSNIFYWHDAGHAQVNENLGFATHKEYLELYGKYTLGVHLHDVCGCSDHMAPSKGELDFSVLKPCLTKGTLKTIEAHYPATAEDLKKSKVFLESLLDDKD